MIKFLNGVNKSENVTEYNVAVFSGAYLYVSYTKGSETGYELTFKVKDKKHPDQNKYFSLMQDGAPYTVTVPQGNTIIPVPIPESCDRLEVTATIGGSANGTTSLEIFFNGDKIGA